MYVNSGLANTFKQEGRMVERAQNGIRHMLTTAGGQVIVPDLDGDAFA